MKPVEKKKLNRLKQKGWRNKYYVNVQVTCLPGGEMLPPHGDLEGNSIISLFPWNFCLSQANI